MTFSEQLLSWYKKNSRDLPWRHTKNPYLIWLSEVIMQQTRIEQGTPYYEKFVAAYPAVKELAGANEEEVLKLWQGLGYYSRARNLHKTARTIMEQYDGKFPDTYQNIRKLKGIGDYTAAAIGSICFNLPFPVVDGNVLRFLSRIFGIRESIDLAPTKRKIHALALKHIDHAQPGDFNQAMMEFGALVCTPANPGCVDCVFSGICVAHNSKTVAEIPARNAKATIRHRYIHYLVVTVSVGKDKFIFLNKRTGRDIWKNLYDFPSLEFSSDNKGSSLNEDDFNNLLCCPTPKFQQVSGPYIHQLTHQKLHGRFYHVHFDKPVELPYLLVPLHEIHQYPVPRLIDHYMLHHILMLK